MDVWKDRPQAAWHHCMEAGLPSFASMWPSFIVQACTGLDLRATDIPACTRLTSLRWCACIIHTWGEGNPDTHTHTHTQRPASAQPPRALCLHPPASPTSSLDLDPHIHSPSAARSHCRKINVTKLCYCVPFLPLPSHCTVGRYRCTPPAGLASQSTPTNRLSLLPGLFKSVSASMRGPHCGPRTGKPPLCTLRVASTMITPPLWAASSATCQFRRVGLHT